MFLDRARWKEPATSRRTLDLHAQQTTWLKWCLTAHKQAIRHMRLWHTRACAAACPEHAVPPPAHSHSGCTQSSMSEACCTHTFAVGQEAGHVQQWQAGVLGVCSAGGLPSGVGWTWASALYSAVAEQAQYPCQRHHHLRRHHLRWW